MGRDTFLMDKFDHRELKQFLSRTRPSLNSMSTDTCCAITNAKRGFGAFE
jgi:hypothetical protein